MRGRASVSYKLFDEKSAVAHARFTKKKKSRCKPNEI